MKSTLVQAAPPTRVAFIPLTALLTERKGLAAKGVPGHRVSRNGGGDGVENLCEVRVEHVERGLDALVGAIHSFTPTSGLFIDGWVGEIELPIAYLATIVTKLRSSKR